jgi:hypothetical protein
MAGRVRMSLVKFKVRFNAQLLREFTVSEMVRATGLNPESVNTELQRMKRERLLERQPLTAGERRSGEGSRALYVLTNNPELLRKLTDSVDAFHLPRADLDRPTSRYYATAVWQLDQAEIRWGAERSLLVDQAALDLREAEKAEGGEAAPFNVKAYLKFQLARVEYLRARFAIASTMFCELKNSFEEIVDEALRTKLDEYLFCIGAWETYPARMDDISEESWAQHLLAEISRSDIGMSPLAALLHRVAAQMTNISSRIATTAFQQILSQSTSELRADLLREFDRIDEVRDRHWIDALIRNSVGAGMAKSEAQAESGIWQLDAGTPRPLDVRPRQSTTPIA